MKIFQFQDALVTSTIFSLSGSCFKAYALHNRCERATSGIQLYFLEEIVFTINSMKLCENEFEFCNIFHPEKRFWWLMNRSVLIRSAAKHSLIARVSINFVFLFSPCHDIFKLRYCGLREKASATKKITITRSRQVVASFFSMVVRGQRSHFVSMIRDSRLFRLTTLLLD